MAVNSETLQSLREAVRADTQESDVSGIISNSSVDRWLNEGMLGAIKEVGKLEKEQEITIISSQAEYALPDDFQDTLTVQYQQASRNELLLPMSKENYLEISVLNTVSIPTHFVLMGEEIFFFQTPSNSGDTVSHRYTAYPAKLSDAGDVPFDGIKRYYPYHLGLISYANYKAFLKMGDQGMANGHLQDWLLNLSTMKRDMSTRKNKGGQMRRYDDRRTKLAYPYIPGRA